MTTQVKENKKVEIKSVTAPSVVTEVTPFGAHKLVNTSLKNHENPLINVLTIRPQMMYNYTSNRTNKGLKPFIPFNQTTGKILVTDLNVWITKYITKKLSFVQPTE